MNPMKQKRAGGERGMSLIELLVAIVILALALLGLAAAGSMAGRQMFTGRSDMGLASTLQYQTEVLVAQGYKKVKTDSAVVFGYPMRWTVSGTDPKKVVLAVARQTGPALMVRDSLVLFFAPEDTLP